jgi:subtilisin family serine protease
MRLRNGVLATTMVASMGAGILPATTAAAEAAPTAAVSGTVTLLTGDRVTVTGGTYHVEPGTPRKVRFNVSKRDGELHIAPSDAVPLLAQGLLDERLFNVSQLLKWNYGDAHQPAIPLIVQSPEGAAPTLSGAKQAKQVPGLGLATMTVPKAEAAKTWQGVVASARTLSAGKSKIWLDGKRFPTLEQSVQQIGAPQAWQQGLTGAGVTVAVLDSGYDPDHPDLKGVVTQSRDFSGEPDPTDRLGHGTHVSATIASAGDRYKGVAPGAKLAVGKLGTRSFTESALLAGMEWAAVETGAKVVNMSLGGPDTLGLDPVEQAVNVLSERTGVLFVVAAGNEGPEATSVSSPGSADAALTVGAVDKSDKMIYFSGRGPRAHDHAIKPDVTAPGVEITAAAAKGTAEGSHVARSGTSMATPHVAGAAAILAQKHPGWTGQQLKAALTGSAAPQPGATTFDQGAGRVDLVRAVAQQVTVSHANLNMAVLYGSTGERTVTREVVYTNAGDTPATLDLTVEGQALRTSAQRVEIPAKGSTPVTVTLDTEGKAPGDYPGTITAKAGDQVVRTVANAYVEPESYDVPISAVARDGTPAEGYGSVYNSAGAERMVFVENGASRIRLPAGEWYLYLNLDSVNRSSQTVAHQAVKVAKGVAVSVDARQGKQIKVSLDDPTAAPGNEFELLLSHGWWSDGWLGFRVKPDENYLIPTKQPGLTIATRSLWHKGGVTPSPYRYDLIDRRTDELPEDPTSSVRVKDLAQVTSTFKGSGAATTGRHYLTYKQPGGDWSGSTLTRNVPMPGTLVQYRTPGYTWQTMMESGSHSQMDAGRRSGGGHTRETWNAAVSGLSFATGGGRREGDTLTFDITRLFTDAGKGRAGMDSDAAVGVTIVKGDQVIVKHDAKGCHVWDADWCAVSATLPPEAAAYTLTATATRNSTLSTYVEAAWTFRSERTAKAQGLPLTAVRFAPQGLDDHNRAKPGSTIRLPIRAERNPGAPAATVKSLRLETSADDGATWTPVPVKATRAGWTAQVVNPSAGSVSLRATATDSNGDTVTQTIRRAYAIG